MVRESSVRIRVRIRVRVRVRLLNWDCISVKICEHAPPPKAPRLAPSITLA